MTVRQKAILSLVAEGKTNREIGVALLLAEETVKSHVRKILAELEAENRAHAVALGFRTGTLT